MSHARNGAPASAAAAAASTPACGRACCVLGQQEQESLGHHAGAIDLLEYMLVGDPAWRPSAAEVVSRTQRLLDRLSA